MTNKFSVYDPIIGRNRKFKAGKYVSYAGKDYGRVLFNGNVLLQDGTTVASIFEQHQKYRKVKGLIKKSLTKNFVRILYNI